MKINRLTALALACCMLLAVLSGCGGEESTPAAAGTNEPAAESVAAPAESEAPDAELPSASESGSVVEAAEAYDYEPLTYPLEGGESFTYYMIKDLGQASSLDS